MTAPSRRHPTVLVTVLLAVVALVTLAAGCGGSGSGAASPASSSTSGATAPGGVVATVPSGSTAVTEPAVDGRTRLAGFEAVTVTVIDADGRTHTVCLLLADTAAARERGLMFVEDPTLGGFDGMLFAFPEDTEDGFWMKNTILPLSIAYVAADGTTVSTTDMAPCPASAPTCPSYPAAGPYRSAIEVPKGRLGDLGISARSTVTVGAKGCAARPSTGSTTPA